MAYTQDDRLISLETPLGKDVLLLQSFTGVEGLSKLFRFELAVRAEQSAIKAEDIIGKGAAITLTLRDGTPRFFNGHVSSFSQHTTGPRLTDYRMEVVPWLWFLTRTADCRIFQNKTVPQIVEQIFTDLKFSDYKLQLKGRYEPCDYCVQYRESDFNFVSRLMEQVGIYYYFQHAKDKHVLVLADDPSGHDACPGQAQAYCEFTEVHGEDVITEWRTGHELRAGQYTVGDFCFETPKNSLLATVAAQHAVGGNAKLELYDFPGPHAKKAQGETLAKVRMQEEEATRLVGYGKSTCRGFTSGYRFDLKGHYRGERNTAYVLTEVRHMASVGSAYATGEELPEEYANEFACIPHAVEFRPPRLTAKPLVQGVQTAIVVGPKGEEIHTDKYGRVRVQFHWDREGAYDEKSSCWIRVAQQWAGKRWGAVFLPRIGQEVIVDFVEGDPDQPIIVGRVYNAEHMPPYALPGEQTKSTIKSYSSKGGGGFNEIRFEDKKGEEQLFVHAEHRHDNRVKRDSLEWVGRDRHLIVERDQLEEIKRDKHLRVEGDQNEQIDGGLSLKIGMSHDQKVGMKLAEEAGMEIHLKGGLNVVVEAGMSVTLKAGAGFVVVGPTGVAISGMPILINSGGAAGAGSGASPDPPKPALEADAAKPGAMASVPPKIVSPQAIALQQAARTGMPFSEKWAPAARQAALARGATPQEANEAAQEAGQAGAAAATEKTWVEIEMVDQDFKPVAGEAYVIVLPDGTRRTGTLDAAGRARIDDIDPGACDVSFPNIDGGEWKRL